MGPSKFRTTPGSVHGHSHIRVVCVHAYPRDPPVLRRVNSVWGVNSVRRQQRGAHEGRRTLPKGVFLPSKRLLSTFYNTPPLLRTLLRTSVSIETLTRRLLRTLLRSTSFKEPSENPSKKRAVAWPPWWCAPWQNSPEIAQEYLFPEDKGQGRKRYG